ncbi:DUF6966 domain-containing protein [Micromonospora zingiberis]|uniref:DUF6966 domain-containing protein n=1 Tax=Micromonospora zingiberis TaxID=2053011 RepID=UPI003B83346F
MPHSRIDENFRRFRSALVELRELLRQHDNEHWAQWADRTLIRIDAADAGGLDYWLSAYGGMGASATSRSTGAISPHPAKNPPPTSGSTSSEACVMGWRLSSRPTFGRTSSRNPGRHPT